MKLADHTEHIRQLIDNAFRRRLGHEDIPSDHEGITPDHKGIPPDHRGIPDGTLPPAENSEKWVEQSTFTLFNRLAAIKVMEAHSLPTEIDEVFPFNPPSLHPTDLNNIINAFDQIATDPQVESGIWISDDVLGALYENYNNHKKTAHKVSGAKTEFNKVSIQSQTYTPRWIVKFLVDNSLGKTYLEMYPDSEIRNRYQIANAPTQRTRQPRPLTEIKLIDPAAGTGNFLLYAFDLFYDCYIDQIRHYGADYHEPDIAKLIITHNLHGIDLDDGAIQIAKSSLYIKAKRHQHTARISHFNLVSSDFSLPAYCEVQHLFAREQLLNPEWKKSITDSWTNLQQAHKFGALLRLDEQLQAAVPGKTACAPALFLQLLTNKYDIAVTNPPYTDSADFGPGLKTFIDNNYKTPHKFHSNLYAAFIKRCYELIDEKGKMALIHPMTFMYIKTFEEVRKFILERLHINVFVEYGLSNLFGSVMVDPAFYVLEKERTTDNTLFISLDQYTRTPNEKYKKDFCRTALDDHRAGRPNHHNISLLQEKLTIIEGWPFIYWISDRFREKFKGKRVEEVAAIRAGIQTSHNERFLRFWWEINKNDLSENYKQDKKRWVRYAKGGPYNKWQGNSWLVIDWERNGQKIQEFLTTRRLDLHAQPYYFREGLTWSASGSKGISFRYLPDNHLFDIGGASAFLIYEFSNLHYLSGLLNSNLVAYIINCLNPTVNVQPIDVKRIPFVQPPPHLEKVISTLAAENVAIKKQVSSWRLIEVEFSKSPLVSYPGLSLRHRLSAYLNDENAKLTAVLLHEAVINQLIFEIYDLSEEDRQQVATKTGRPVGELPVSETARTAWLAHTIFKQPTVGHTIVEQPPIEQPFIEQTHIEEPSIEQISIEHSPTEQALIHQHILALPVNEFKEQQIKALTAELDSLYQNNYNLEDFCIHHQLNPIDVWYWFRESSTLPQGRAAEIALEFLADAFRTLLMEDEDGIIPLTGSPSKPGKPGLLEKLKSSCLQRQFTAEQFLQLDSLLGHPIKEYIEHHFFKDLSDQLNLFMYLPKTPFLWHISSGEHQGFEAYTIIYKWNRDSLYKLKNNYLHQRTGSLQDRLAQIQDNAAIEAQTEKATLIHQLQEIAHFAQKIDELIAEGYDPKPEDGVGKNIAPLQQKGMLRTEVLHKRQLQKYRKADW